MILLVALFTGTFTVRILIHRCHLIRSQETTTWSTRSPHGVIVPRFMKVRFSSFGRESEGFFETLPCYSPLEYAMELLRVDVQRRLFRTTGYNFRRLLVLLYVRLWWRHLWWYRNSWCVMIHERWLWGLNVRTADMLRHASLLNHVLTLLNLYLRW